MTAELAREAREAADRLGALIAMEGNTLSPEASARVHAAMNKLDRLAAALDGAPAAKPATRFGQFAAEPLPQIPADYAAPLDGCNTRQLIAERDGAPAAPDGLVERLLSFCDPSNWDSDGKRGDYYRGWKEATDEVHQIAMDHMEGDALPAPTPAPEPGDWVRVPKQPTEEMIEAGWIDKEDVSPAEIYHAMLTAAPSQPAQDAGLIERAHALLVATRFLKEPEIVAARSDLLAALKAAPIPVEVRLEKAADEFGRLVSNKMLEAATAGAWGAGLHMDAAAASTWGSVAADIIAGELPKFVRALTAAEKGVGR